MNLKRISQVRLPTILLWFLVAFAAICLIPWHPSKTGKLLPLATPYLNEGLADRAVQVLLAAHILASIIFASVAEALRRLAKGSATRAAAPDLAREGCSGRSRGPVGRSTERDMGAEWLARTVVTDGVVVAGPLDPTRLTDNDLRDICQRMHAILGTVEMSRCEGRLMPVDLFDAIDTLADNLRHGPRPKLPEWLGVIGKFGAYYRLAGNGPIAVDAAQWREAVSLVDM